MTSQTRNPGACNARVPEFFCLAAERPEHSRSAPKPQPLLTRRRVGFAEFEDAGAAAAWRALARLMGWRAGAPTGPVGGTSDD